MAKNCKTDRNCVSDYFSFSVTSITGMIIIAGIGFIILKRHTPEIKAKQFSMLVMQGLASLIWLGALLMTNYMPKHGNIGVWATCYLWPVWLEMPFGYCLVVSCHIARGYRLYYVFVRRRLPPLQSWHVVLLLLVPSVCIAAVIQSIRPFVKRDNYCDSTIKWLILTSSVHVAYICVLVVSTWMIRNIRFEFNESRELLTSVCMCVLFLGVWMAFQYLGEYHKRHVKRDDGLQRFQSAASYITVILGSATALCFSLFPVMRPLRCYLGGMKMQKDSDSMGQVLGVPSSGLLRPGGSSFRFDEPLEALLQHRRFRQAFQSFADSRMAGESIRFYAEVSELNKIPSTTPVTRIYMAQNIIETYIDIGSPLELNISHPMRLEILSTRDLSNPTLFDRASHEAMRIMRMNLEQDFWKSVFYEDLKEEIDSETQFGEQLEWMNISSKRDSFSTTDNLFDPMSSPGYQMKPRSPSPSRNMAFTRPRSPTKSPQKRVSLVANNSQNLKYPSAPASPVFKI